MRTIKSNEYKICQSQQKTQFIKTTTPKNKNKETLPPSRSSSGCVRVKYQSISITYAPSERATDNSVYTSHSTEDTRQY